MELSQATGYFNTLTIEGWDGTTWQPLAVVGNLHAFDRFLGPRTFGQKQRIFLIGGADKIPDKYEFIRIPNSHQYLLLSYNQDIRNDKVYATSYVIQEANVSVDIIKLSTPIAAPSGLSGNLVRKVETSTFCDFERYSGEEGRNIDALSYIKYSFILPKSAPITTDDLLRVNGIDYEVREVNPLLNVQEIRAVKRGTET